MMESSLAHGDRSLEASIREALRQLMGAIKTIMILGISVGSEKEKLDEPSDLKLHGRLWSRPTKRFSSDSVV
jgi:hypothetical protein